MSDISELKCERSSPRALGYDIMAAFCKSSLKTARGGGGGGEAATIHLLFSRLINSGSCL